LPAGEVFLDHARKIFAAVDTGAEETTACVMAPPAAAGIAPL